jgi:glycosyltransferase involved in cell wall biosynthesis
MDMTEHYDSGTVAFLRDSSYLSRRHRLLYVSVPKAACTSLKWWFAAIEGREEALRSLDEAGESDVDRLVHDSFYKVAPDVTHLKSNVLIEALASDSLFRFAVTRNPYKRIFSAWQSKILLREPQQIEPYLKSGFIRHPLECAEDIAQGFEMFLEHLSSNEAPEFRDYHWTPQFDLLRPDRIDYSMVAQIEKPAELSRALAEWSNGELPDPMSAPRRNEGLMPYLPEFLTPRSAELLQKLYADDFRVFNYDTSPPPAKEPFDSAELAAALKATKMVRARHERIGALVSQVQSLSGSLTERDAEIASLGEIVGNKSTELGQALDALAQSSRKVEVLSRRNEDLARRDWLAFVRRILSAPSAGDAKRRLRASELFDGRYYLESNPDLRARQVDPAAHYLNHGWKELRNPSRIFDTASYLADNVDVAAAGLNPLVHYLKYGRKEGRRLSAPGVPDGRLPARKAGGPQVAGEVGNLVKLARAVRPAVAFYHGSWLLAARRVAGILAREGAGGVLRRAAILAGVTHLDAEHLGPARVYGDVPASTPDYSPRVSVIVPGYNHAGYLRQRLDSIYGQTYQNIEVILLDDCSTDESVAVMKEYADRHPDRTLCCFNRENSGSVFRQWKRGLELATGELVWIAESDDYCSENFLAELVRAFRNQAVRLAFSRTSFVGGPLADEIWNTESYTRDIGLDIWGTPFVHSAHALVKCGWAVKNLVPNVSSAVFRHPGRMPLFDDPVWLNLRLCGDWVFYLSLVRGGLVAYSPGTTNYYRQHQHNTSVNAQREDLYYREHEIVAGYLARLFRIERTDLEWQERHLYAHWCSRRGGERRADFLVHYDIGRALQTAAERKPNVVMAVYALSAGGGETFPIMLANLLNERGYAVTLLNCAAAPTEPGVRRLLSPAIPLLELERLQLAAEAFRDMGAEIVHSHHAWVDVSLANLLLGNPDVRHVVSTHGMYEMMPREQLQSLVPILRQVDGFVYTAEKNLAGLPTEIREGRHLRRIDNALPESTVTPVSRTELGIPETDFVACLVARAIPEKGWEEAIQAVEWANEHTGDRRVHLLLIGEGPEYDRLKSAPTSAGVHFLGFRSNIRDYFAASDVGLLPSRFKGESAPLVLIDCLRSGRPVVATAIAEIPHMLDAGDGPAGELMALDDWRIDIEKLGAIIAGLATEPERYSIAKSRVGAAVSKFDVSTMIGKYEDIYTAVLGDPPISEHSGLVAGIDG